MVVEDLSFCCRPKHGEPYVTWTQEMEQLSLRIMSHLKFKISVGKYLISEALEARRRKKTRPGRTPQTLMFTQTLSINVLFAVMYRGGTVRHVGTSGYATTCAIWLTTRYWHVCHSPFHCDIVFSKGVGGHDSGRGGTITSPV